MRILIVKTSSLGDIVHALPVATDLRRAYPGVLIDWCVEENFAALPRLHPAVDRVIPVAIRRWRKQLTRTATWKEIAHFRRELRLESYDAVIDLQGLLKSAVICSQAKGPVIGYAAESAREPIAARFYDADFAIPTKIHAVQRNRWLTAAALELPMDETLDYGISTPALQADWLPATPYVVMLSASSRDDKLWPENHWLTLGTLLHEQGVRAVLPAGSPAERERAARLALAIPGAIAAPPLDLDDLARLLVGSVGTIGVDTGLTHLAAALGRPTVALYTATEPGLTGVLATSPFQNLGGTAQIPSALEATQATLACCRNTWPA